MPQPIEQNPIDAITTKLNEALTPHELKVKITFQTQYLQIVIFSATKVPKQDSVIALVEQVIAEVDLGSVRKITIYGKSNSSVGWAWKKDISVNTSPKTEQAEVQLQSSPQERGQDPVVAELALIRKELVHLRKTLYKEIASGVVLAVIILALLNALVMLVFR